MSVEIPQPLLFSFLAGLSTCIGASVVFCGGQPSQKHLGLSLSLAGSVMITVSVVSILPAALGDSLSLDEALSFATGSIIYIILSKFAFPEPEAILFTDLERQETAESIDSTISISSTQSTPIQQRMRGPRPATVESIEVVYNPKDDKASLEVRRAWRVTLLLFVSLLLHNFPEGLAVAASTVHSTRLGWTTTIAIALHNIPEGFCIAVPSMAAYPDRPGLAFGLAALSGLAEPIGALVALQFQGSLPIDAVLSLVAGIMMTVAIVELYPEAWRYRGRGMITLGTVMGVLLMLGTELYLSE